MGMKEFLISALGSALELGIGTTDDVLKYITPDVLSVHLPRPLWARLITACLGAPKVNSQLVVDTIGIPNLCEHMPHTLLWNVLSDIGARSLGKAGTSVSASASASASTTTSSSASASGAGPIATAARITPASGIPVIAPIAKTAPASGPVTTPATGPIPIPTGAAPATAAGSTPAAAPAEQPRSRSPSRQPFRQVGTAGAASRGGALSPSAAATARRPQAAAPAAPDRTPAPALSPQPASASALVGSRVTPPSPRRGTTATDFDIDTDVRAEAWKSKDVEVDDDQLIDWSSSEETVTTGDGFGDRKPRG